MLFANQSKTAAVNSFLSVAVVEAGVRAASLVFWQLRLECATAADSWSNSDMKPVPMPGAAHIHVVANKLRKWCVTPSVEYEVVLRPHYDLSVGTRF